MTSINEQNLACMEHIIAYRATIPIVHLYRGEKPTFWVAGLILAKVNKNKHVLLWWWYMQWFIGEIYGTVNYLYMGRMTAAYEWLMRWSNSRLYTYTHTSEIQLIHVQSDKINSLTIKQSIHKNICNTGKLRVYIEGIHMSVCNTTHFLLITIIIQSHVYKQNVLLSYTNIWP